MDQKRAAAGHEYFSKLYSGASKQGGPQQTIFDKWRDRILFNTYAKYSFLDLSESDVLDVGCGYGWLLDAFQGARSLCGVDIAHHAVEVAAGRPAGWRERRYRAEPPGHGGRHDPPPGGRG